MRNMFRAALVIATLATPMLASAEAPKAKAPAATEKKDEAVVAPTTDKKAPATDAKKPTAKKDVKKTATTKKDAAPATK